MARDAAQAAALQAGVLIIALLPASVMLVWAVSYVGRLSGSGMAVLLVMLTGLMACGVLWLSLRVALDAWIFARWAWRWRRGKSVEEDLLALDQRLSRLSGLAPRAGRTLTERLLGTRALLRRHGGTQLLLLIILTIDHVFIGG